MNDGWFSVEFSRKLVWFSLLSLLSLMSFYVHRGRHRTLVLSIWAAVFALGVLCLCACAVGLAVGQPSHVFRPLLVVGVVVTVVFGTTFNSIRRGYQDAELRKTIAQDI
jgi:tellurite resistance protein TehA-like permease